MENFDLRFLFLSSNVKCWRKCRRISENLKHIISPSSSFSSPSSSFSSSPSSSSFSSSSSSSFSSSSSSSFSSPSSSFSSSPSSSSFSSPSSSLSSFYVFPFRCCSSSSSSYPNPSSYPSASHNNNINNTPPLLPPPSPHNNNIFSFFFKTPISYSFWTCRTDSNHPNTNKQIFRNSSFSSSSFSSLFSFSPPPPSPSSSFFPSSSSSSVFRLTDFIVVPWIRLLSFRGKKYLPFHPIAKKSKHHQSREKNRSNLTKKLSSSSSEVKDDGSSINNYPRPRCSPFQAVRLVHAFSGLMASSSSGREGEEGGEELKNTEEEEKEKEEGGGDSNVILYSLDFNVDLKRESLRGVCQLPHGLGSEVKVAVFCEEEEASEMIAAGADFAGLSSLIERIGKGWLGFDRCIASPDVMPKLLRVARILGPKKLMPNPKSGTIVRNLKAALKASKSGAQVEFRAVDDGTVRVAIGKTTMKAEMILENMKHFTKEVLRARPKSAGMTADTTDRKTVFSWPPQRKQKTNDQPAIPELGGGSSLKSSTSEDFLLGGSLESRGCPRIRLEPSLMAPSSVGYYR